MLWRKKVNVDSAILAGRSVILNALFFARYISRFWVLDKTFKCLQNACQPNLFNRIDPPLSFDLAKCLKMSHFRETPVQFSPNLFQ